MTVWPEGWRNVSGPESIELAQQLRREMSSSHILHDAQFMVIARRDDQDDVLLELADGRLAELHMTWAASNDPKLPGALLFDDLEDWLAVQV
ncbi:MAG: hypothetical protein ABW199_12210 [Caulobacterales bacterium]